MTTPTQVMKFANCAVINGQLVPNTEHQLQEGDFVVNSDLTIPDTIPQSVQQFINNYTTKNPNVHTELDQHRERPFLELELAYMAYSCFARLIRLGTIVHHLGLSFCLRMMMVLEVVKVNLLLQQHSSM